MSWRPVSTSEHTPYAFGSCCSEICYVIYDATTRAHCKRRRDESYKVNVNHSLESVSESFNRSSNYADDPLYITYLAEVLIWEENSGNITQTRKAQLIKTSLVDRGPLGVGSS